MSDKGRFSLLLFSQAKSCLSVFQFAIFSPPFTLFPLLTNNPPCFLHLIASILNTVYHTQRYLCTHRHWRVDHLQPLMICYGSVHCTVLLIITFRLMNLYYLFIAVFLHKRGIILSWQIIVLTHNPVVSLVFAWKSCLHIHDCRMKTYVKSIRQWTGQSTDDGKHGLSSNSGWVSSKCCEIGSPAVTCFFVVFLKD